jgi:hypothetical protein
VRENAAAKAARYLVEGRLIVTRVHAGHVTSSCRGDGHIWLQSFTAGTWRCTCPARSQMCSHLIALRRVVAVDLR